MKVVGYCEQCNKKHAFDFDPMVRTNHFSDWYTKHCGHEGVGFSWPERSPKSSIFDYLKRFWRFIVRRVAGTSIIAASLVAANPQIPDIGDPPSLLAMMLHNADVKTAYASSAAYSITLASLATSSTLLAGREGDAVSNTTNLYLDYLISSKITVGTTPTTSTQIEVWAYASYNDTPLYPDVFDGTDSAETVNSAAIKASSLVLISTLPVDSNTSDRGYYGAPTSLALRHGGFVPKNHGLFVTHNTAVNLNSTAGNHVMSYTGVYATVTG